MKRERSLAKLPQPFSKFRDSAQGRGYTKWSWDISFLVVLQINMLYLCCRSHGELGDDVESVVLNKRREENCSGEVFFKCLLEGSQADVNDLVDFVELKEGKDYTLWLKNWQKYHRWRLEKTAVLRWKRKKMTMRMMNRRKR